jgi:predicted dehydrogenase
VSKLKVGVIGLGVGRGHIRGYRQHPDVEVAALCDADPARLAEIGAEAGIKKLYASPAEMYKAEKLDLVSVCTPNKFHKPLTLQAFKAGCHVLCEKPMAMNATEGKAMLQASKKFKKRLMINFSYRFSPQARALKDKVESGIIGEPYFARSVWHRRNGIPKFGGWFGQKALSGGGPLIDLGVHRLDFALWLMNFPKPAWVLGRTYDMLGSAAAKAEKKAFDVEDLAVAMIAFKNGTTIELEASWKAHVQQKELMETRLLGTKGGLLQRNPDGDYRFESEIYLMKDGQPQDLKVEPTETPLSSMHYFADCILKKKPHMAGPEEGLQVSRILDAIYESAEKGKPVKL